MLALSTLCSIGCVPWVVNLKDSYRPPAELTSHVRDDQSVLVLPVWFDSMPCNVRHPFLTTAGSLARGDIEPKNRHRLGMLRPDGHGPTYFRSLSGIAVVTACGRALWFGDYGFVGKRQIKSAERDAIVDEIRRHRPPESLNAWDWGLEDPPEIPFFGWACAGELNRFVATTRERHDMIDFLNGIDLPETQAGRVKTKSN